MTERKWSRGVRKGDLPDTDELNIEQALDRRDRPQQVDHRVQNSIAVVVTLVWATSFIADIVSKEYSPPAGIHAAFILIVGSIFGGQIIQGGKK